MYPISLSTKRTNSSNESTLVKLSSREEEYVEVLYNEPVEKPVFLYNDQPTVGSVKEKTRTSQFFRVFDVTLLPVIQKK